MADIIILLLIIGYCIFVIVHRHKKAKKAAASGGCPGGCAGCSGCGNGCPSGRELKEKG